MQRRIAAELVDCGQEVDAARWRTLAKCTTRGDLALCLIIAREYANRLMRIAQISAKLSSRQIPVLRRRLVDDALALIRDAVAAGFNNGRPLRTDPQLTPIPDEPRFGEIVADLEFPAQAFARR